MATRSEEFERLEAEIFSIALSVGNVVYISIAQLESDYIDLNGRPIPYREFNFSSLRDMLAAMSDKLMLVDYNGQGTAVVPISNSRTRHLERLIEQQNQKSDEPTRFGGVVPGLDNKETNRARNLARSGGTTRVNRARSEGPQNTIIAAANNILENHKRTVSTIRQSVILNDNRNIPESRTRSLSTICAAVATERKSVAENVESTQMRRRPNEVVRSTKSEQIPSKAESRREATISKNAHILKAESDRLWYAREHMMEMRKHAQIAAASLVVLPPEVCGEQTYPDMDFIEFVVHNVIAILGEYPNGLSLQELDYLYARFFPSDPQLELIESLGLSLEEFFQCNMQNELKVTRQGNVTFVRLCKFEQLSSIRSVGATGEISEKEDRINNNTAKIDNRIEHLQTYNTNAIDDNRQSNRERSVSSSLIDSPLDYNDFTEPAQPASCVTSMCNLSKPMQNLIAFEDDPAILLYEPCAKINVPSSEIVSTAANIVPFERPLYVTEFESLILPSTVCQPSPCTSSADCVRRQTTSNVVIVEEPKEQLRSIEESIVEISTGLESTSNAYAGSTVSSYSMSLTPPAAYDNFESLIDYSEKASMPEMYPEKAPPIGKINSTTVKVPQNMWENFYSILREYPDGLEHVQFVQEYQSRFKRTLGGNYLIEKCKHSSLQKVMAEIGHVEVFYNAAGVVSYGLRRRDGHSKRFYSKSTKIEIKDDYEDFFEDDHEEIYLSQAVFVPPQPQQLLPPGGSVPESLRKRIYNLLLEKYSKGVPLHDFTIAYQHCYGDSINVDMLCKMSTLVQLFRSLGDIVDIGQDEKGVFWIKPKDRDEVTRLATMFRAPPPSIDTERRTKTFAPDPPPASCVASDVRDRLEKFLDPCGVSGLQFYNFRTLYEQPSLKTFLSFYGYQSFDQFVDCCVQHKLLNIFETVCGEKRVRLKKYAIG